LLKKDLTSVKQHQKDFTNAPKVVMNVACYKLGCYERGLLWTGLLRTGLVWTWSVLYGMLWVAWYEQVCFERVSPPATLLRLNPALPTVVGTGP